jgi:flagellar FliL protein
MSLVCPKCNTENIEEASFCKECGNELLADEVINEDKETVKKEQNLSQSSEEISLFGTFLYVVIFVIALVVIDSKYFNTETTEPIPNQASGIKEVIHTGTINDLVLNITTSKGKEGLMKLSLTMTSTEPTIKVLLDASKHEIIDDVIHQISSRHSEELLTDAGKDLLKEELLNDVNRILNDAIAVNPVIKEKNIVKDIYFTTFVIKITGE